MIFRSDAGKHGDKRNCRSLRDFGVHQTITYIHRRLRQRFQPVESFDQSCRMWLMLFDVIAADDDVEELTQVLALEHPLDAITVFCRNDAETQAGISKRGDGARY